MAYEAGQHWNYRTRDQDPDSTLLILRVEDIPRVGPVAFISITGLHVVDPRAAGGSRSEIQFTEITTEALSQSVTALRGKRLVPDHQTLYQGWRRAFDAGNADVFRQPVAEIVRRFQTVCDSANLRQPRFEWWLMDTLPDLIWARLTVLTDGTAEVFDSDGKTYRFETEEEARLSLLEDEFMRWTSFDASDFAGEPLQLDEVHPPIGSSDSELLPQMLVRWRR